MIQKIRLLKNFLILNKGIHHKKSKLTLKQAILSIFVTLFIILIGSALIINNYLSKINKVILKPSDSHSNYVSQTKDTIADQENNISSNNNDNNIENIALFGIDEIEGTAGRSDCIMILTIDNKHKKLKLSSIIRDSYVNIPTKNNKDKINHAYAFGGPKLALETINENFNLNIDKFITVNFSSLPKIIDDIGGIPLVITDEELKYINGYINDLNNLNKTNSTNIVTSDNQQFDGTQALAYCRIRYTDGGDFERSQRQRTVLNKLMEKCKTLSLTQYPSLLSEVLPIVHTNLEKSEILSLAFNLNSLRNETLLQDRFPRDEDGKGQLIGGIYYYVFDETSTVKKIQNFIYEN